MHFLNSYFKNKLNYKAFLGLLIFTFLLETSGFNLQAKQAYFYSEYFLVKDSSLLDKKISLKIFNENFRSVIKKLNTIYNIDFVYVEEQIPWHQKVTFQTHQKSLAFVLDILVKNKGLTYFLVDDQVAITTSEVKAGIQIDSAGKAEIKKDTLKKPDPRYYNKINFKVFNKGSGIGKIVGTQTYYVKKHFSFWPTPPNPELKDSLQQAKDSLEAKKKKAQNSHAEFSGNKRIQLGFKIAPSWTWWKVRSYNASLVDNPSWNQYLNPQSSFAAEFSFGIMLRKHTLLETGLGFINIYRKGYVEEFRRNTLIPLIDFHERKNYSNHYTYLVVPVKLSYAFSYKNLYLLTGVGLQANVFIGSDMKSYLIYKTQYYTDINLLSGGNGNYSDSKGEPIKKQNAKFTKLIYSYLLFTELGFKIHKNASLNISAEVNGFLYSIYQRKSPLREVPLNIHLAFGSRIYF